MRTKNLKVGILVIMLLQSMVSSAQGYILVTSVQTQLESVSHADLTKLYMGDKSLLDDSIYIRLARLGDESAVTRTFVNEVLGLEPDQYIQHWRRRLFSGKGIPPKVLNSSEEMAHYIESTPKAIGFLPTDDLSRFPSLKKISIK